ncbi:MAG: hypothetical protein AAGF12_04655 [Myxococcota bacterium]
MKWIRRLLDRWIPKRRPVTNIRDLEPGSLYRVEGEALALHDPVPGPFSGIPCASLTLVQDALSGERRHQNRPQWNRVADIDFGQKFMVRDDTGMVRIDRMGWSRLIAPTFAPRPGHEENLEQFRARFMHHAGLFELEKRGLDSWISDVRCRVQVVPQSARVSVTGLVRATGEAMPGATQQSYREAPKLLELIPGEDHLVIEVLPALP